MRWLIVIDESDRSMEAAAFAAQLALPGEDEVLLLAVGTETGAVELDRAQGFFGGFEPRILSGIDPAAGAVNAAAGEQVDVVVYGSRGRRGLSRLFLGSVAAHLEHKLPCSLLVVRGEAGPIRNILAATGLYPGRRLAVELSGRIAARTGAHVTVLHVMSQLPLHDEAQTGPLEATADEAIRLHTQEGDALQERLVYLKDLGISADVRLRHGLVLDEVGAELAQGNYDLLVIGGHRTPADLAFADLLAEDVADDILMHTKSHVLIA